MHFNPKTGVYGQSPYADLIDNRISWSAQQAAADKANRLSPREATMNSQTRRLSQEAAGRAATQEAAQAIPEASAIAEQQAGKRGLGLVGRVGAGTVAALLEILTNPLPISERSSMYDPQGRTWEQHDNDRAATQHYFDRYNEDAGYRGQGADATAIHSPIYKAPEMQSAPIRMQEYTMQVPQAPNYGGSIAQQLSTANPDDAWLEQERRKKLAADIAASQPRKSGYGGNRLTTPTPLLGDKIAF